MNGTQLITILKTLINMITLTINDEIEYNVRYLKGGDKYKSFVVYKQECIISLEELSKIFTAITDFQAIKLYNIALESSLFDLIAQNNPNLLSFGLRRCDFNYIENQNENENTDHTTIIPKFFEKCSKINTLYMSNKKEFPSIKNIQLKNVKHLIIDSSYNADTMNNGLLMPNLQLNTFTIVTYFGMFDHHFVAKFIEKHDMKVEFIETKHIPWFENKENNNREFENLVARYTPPEVRFHALEIFLLIKCACFYFVEILFPLLINVQMYRRIHEKKMKRSF